MEQLLETLQLLGGSGILYGLYKLLKFLQGIWREYQIFRMCKNNPLNNIEVEVTTKTMTNTETVKIKSTCPLPP